MIFALPAVIISAKLCCVCNTERYRSGHNGTDSKFLEAPAVSSAENVRRTGLCAGSDFTISYRSCVFFLHSSGARITLEIYGELSERSKVRHSKSAFFGTLPQQNLIWRGIEVVITGLTRNQFASNRTWVRIPSSPPMETA